MSCLKYMPYSAIIYNLHSILCPSTVHNDHLCIYCIDFRRLVLGDGIILCKCIFLFEYDI